MLRIGIMLGLISSLLSSCYSLEQAYWFNNAFNSRMPVAEALQTPEMDESGRRKLLLSRQLLKFAEQQGLAVADAYQHYIPPGPGTVSYLVQAAPVDRLELTSWWFPLVGRVPYLGFFNKSARDEKAKELRADGLDVSLGTVGAFSSLGWFADPIYDSMIKRKDEDLIQLLLHELVHRSFWSRGSVAFNENLAEFSSLQLTEKYLEQTRAGVGLQEMKSYRAEKDQLSQWILSLREALKQLYARKDFTREQKILEKQIIIQDFRERRFPDLTIKELKAAKDREWNNASILGAALYAPRYQAISKGFRLFASRYDGGISERFASGRRGLSERRRSPG